MMLHEKGAAMSQSELRLQPRSGVYAWDQRDACSIASHTPSYGGVLPGQRREAEPEMAIIRGGASVPVRLAAALLARIRPRPRLDSLHG
jgi:hypothetical protein